MWSHVWLLLHPCILQIIILRHGDEMGKNGVIRESLLCHEIQCRALHMHECCSSQQLWEFRPEEIGWESHVINKHAKPTYKPRLSDTIVMLHIPIYHSASQTGRCKSQRHFQWQPNMVAFTKVGAASTPLLEKLWVSAPGHHPLVNCTWHIFFLSAIMLFPRHNPTRRLITF